MPPLVTPRRVLAARVIAILVDLAQYALLPATLTPLNNAIDVVTGFVMIWLVGWHWAFLPTFLAEMVPFVDLVPTWTLAVMFATRGAGDPPMPQPPLPPNQPLLPPTQQPPPQGNQSREPSGS
jgi:hypothetical protein